MPVSIKLWANDQRHSFKRLSNPALLCIALCCSLLATAISAQDNASLLSTAHNAYLAGNFSVAQQLLDKAMQQGTSNLRLEVERALLDDALGRPEQARRHYDRLSKTAWREITAVPSAANLAALGRTQEASRAFRTIAAASHSNEEKTEAQLWQLWLITRMHADKRSQRAALSRQLSTVHPQDPAQRALLDLYRGKADTASVFAAIDRLQPSPQRRQALIAQSTLFAGGYLEAIRNDPNAALWLYGVELRLPRVACPEQPLIIKAARALSPASSAR